MTTKTDKRWRDMKRTHGGKGDALRPQDIKKYRENWERIFNNEPKEDTQEDVKDVPQDPESFGQEKI